MLLTPLLYLHACTHAPLTCPSTHVRVIQAKAMLKRHDFGSFQSPAACM